MTITKNRNRLPPIIITMEVCKFSSDARNLSPFPGLHPEVKLCLNRDTYLSLIFPVAKRKQNSPIIVLLDSNDGRRIYP